MEDSQASPSAESQIRRRRQRIRRQLDATERRRWRWGQPSSSDFNRPSRRWSSRQLHRLGAVVSHAWAGVVVLLLALGWVCFGAVINFPSYWLSTLEAITSILAVVLLFAIQHLHARDQTAMQRKLDEILRSIPGADNKVIAVEEAPDEELDALTELNREDRLH